MTPSSQEVESLDFPGWFTVPGQSGQVTPGHGEQRDVQAGQPDGGDEKNSAGGLRQADCYADRT